MKTVRILAALALTSSLLACSSSDPGGVTGEGEGTGEPELNPYGVAYPTDNVGISVGQKIQNYKFLGYPNGNPAEGLQQISLAQYFDPNGQTILNGKSPVRILHIQAAGSWCTYCRQEMKLVGPLKDELESRGVVWLLSLAEGPTQGQPSKQTDLDAWIATFNAPVPHVLDPGNKNLGQFYDAAALPWNANIDAKTMTILTANVGATTTKEGLLKELDAALAKTAQ